MLGHDTSLGSSTYISQALWTTKNSTLGSQKPRRTMSSPNHQHQIYEVPHMPSSQLQAVLDYFDCLKTWDFEKITKLSTPYFSQKTLPASLGVPARSKSEDIKYLHTLRDSLKGGPLEVCDHGPFPPRLSELTSLRSPSYTMSMRTRAKFGSTYVLSLIQSKVPDALCAADDEGDQPRVHPFIHIWNGQRRELFHQPHRVFRQQNVL